MSNLEDEVRRIVSEFEQKELSRELDALFATPASPLPDENDTTCIEDELDEFERQLEEGVQISVRDYIGSPAVRALSEVPPGELEEELDRLLSILYDNWIVLDFLYDIEASEAYRFITEELLDEMMTDVRVPEFYTHFLYEEFHPNDVEDIKQLGIDFLRGFLSEQHQGLWDVYASDGLVNQAGEELTLERVLQLMHNFYILHNPMSPSGVEVVWASIEGDEGSAAFSIMWHELDEANPEVVKKTATAALHFRRSPYGGWDIVQATLPFE